MICISIDFLFFLMFKHISTSAFTMRVGPAWPCIWVTTARTPKEEPFIVPLVLPSGEACSGPL